MFESFDSYLKYVAYTKLYNRVKNCVDKYTCEEKDSHWFADVINREHRELKREVKYYPIFTTDSIQATVEHQIINSRIHKYEEFVSTAWEEYTTQAQSVEDCNPDIVMDKINYILKGVKEELLKV